MPTRSRKSPRIQEQPKSKKESKTGKKRGAIESGEEEGVSFKMLRAQWGKDQEEETEKGSVTDPLEAAEQVPEDGQPETLRMLAAAPKEPLSSVLRRSMEAVGMKVDTTMKNLDEFEKHMELQFAGLADGLMPVEAMAKSSVEWRRKTDGKLDELEYENQRLRNRLVQVEAALMQKMDRQSEVATTIVQQLVRIAGRVDEIIAFNATIPVAQAL